MQPKPQLSNTRMLVLTRSCMMVPSSEDSIWKPESPTTVYSSQPGSAIFTPMDAPIS